MPHHYSLEELANVLIDKLFKSSTLIPACMHLKCGTTALLRYGKGVKISFATSAISK